MTLQRQALMPAAAPATSPRPTLHPPLVWRLWERRKRTDSLAVSLVLASQ